MSIKIHQLSKNYGNTVALKNISLAFDKNGVIGLLGPNGAGKTTLMKILTGYLNQWEGKVSIGTFDLQEQPKKNPTTDGLSPRKQSTLHRDVCQRISKICGAAIWFK